MPRSSGMRRWGLGLALLLVAFATFPALAFGQTGPTQAEQALQKVKDLKQGIGVHTGRELTPAMAELFRTKGDLDASGRKEAAALLARPTDGGGDPQGDGYTVTEETPFCTVHFCIHYVATTADAPDLTDTTPAARGSRRASYRSAPTATSSSATSCARE